MSWTTTQPQESPRIQEPFNHPYATAHLDALRTLTVLLALSVRPFQILGQSGPKRQMRSTYMRLNLRSVPAEQPGLIIAVEPSAVPFVEPQGRKGPFPETYQIRLYIKLATVFT